MEAIAANGRAIAFPALFDGEIHRLALDVDGHVRVGPQDHGPLPLDHGLDDVVADAPAAVAHEVFHVQEDASFEHGWCLRRMLVVEYTSAARLRKSIDRSQR